MSSLTDVTSRTKELWEARRYYVVRGAIDWAAHDFDRWPSAVALLLDRGSLFQVPQTPGHSLVLTMEVFARKTFGSPAGSDEGLLEKMLKHTIEVIDGLLDSKNDVGDSVIIGFDQRESRFVQVIDDRMKVQGHVASLYLTY